MNQSMTPYHHGDLRNCAIIAAAELIESIGSYDITIAQVAKRVGVSAPALYRHFTDKDALLTAVRELTHLGIMDYITRAQADIEHGRWPTSMPWVQPIYATQRTKKRFLVSCGKTMEIPRAAAQKHEPNGQGFRFCMKRSNFT